MGADRVRRTSLCCVCIKARTSSLFIALADVYIVTVVVVVCVILNILLIFLEIVRLLCVLVS